MFCVIITLHVQFCFQCFSMYGIHVPVFIQAIVQHQACVHGYI